jgi:FkbM family methyltransferase
VTSFRHLVRRLVVHALRAEARTLKLRGTSRVARIVAPAGTGPWWGSSVIPYEGGLIQADPRNHIEWAVYMLGGYDLAGVDLLKRLVQPGTVVLDIGANVGVFTIPLAMKVGRSGGVHAFEPHPRVRARLVRNLALSNLRNVTVSGLAVGEHAGTVNLYGATDANEGASSLAPAAGRGEVFSCEMGTVDEYIVRTGISSVSLVKIDVEGADHAVLLGARETMAAYKPAVYVEVQASHLAELGASPGGIFHLLRELGYEMWCKSDRGLTGWDLTPVSQGELPNGDWLAIHPASIPD